MSTDPLPAHQCSSKQKLRLVRHEDGFYYAQADDTSVRVPLGTTDKELAERMMETAAHEMARLESLVGQVRLGPGDTTMTVVDFCLTAPRVV